MSAVWQWSELYARKPGHQWTCIPQKVFFALDQRAQFLMLCKERRLK